jgi:predicted CXXCH cytochrome family protein
MKVILRTLPAVLTALILSAAPLGANGLSASDADPHEGLACARCHLGATARAIATAGPNDPDPRSRTCRTCHRDLGTRGSAASRQLGFHDDPKADCAGCHTFHELGRLKTAVGDLKMSAQGLGEGVPAHCAGCHEPGADLGTLSPAHRAAAALYHRDAALLVGMSPSQGCLNCHADDSGSTWQGEAGGQTLKFNQHATHPLGVLAVAGSGRDERKLRSPIDPRLRLFDEKVECLTCHSLTGGQPDLLVAFPSQPELCLGCHQLKNSNPSPAQDTRLMAVMADVP